MYLGVYGRSSYLKLGNCPAIEFLVRSFQEQTLLEHQL